MERLPESDSESFLSTCDNIRRAMNKIAKLKTSGDANVCILIKKSKFRYWIFLEN